MPNIYIHTHPNKKREKPKKIFLKQKRKQKKVKNTPPTGNLREIQSNLTGEAEVRGFCQLHPLVPLSWEGI